ncbi:ABC transporter permease [Verrucomicrobiaceae bacterium R5-34]|uniref:Oligopeptide transport system permease protein OppC n=1 Tax=Oceaniferula flava TaxID=2800421 RepID=A0AAE2V8E5_9BACT|nr:ABC transporter permease [Oceaniferula flavus]MBK1829246.1 ABC transporter permease [Verrucomicrobiaceae bacterium R5-34]MBK1853483.1 ABC transporter permease [Oceaniferula flavus]MBM1134788.1 ABC transporter permease [Oceaniferula flavus]
MATKGSSLWHDAWMRLRKNSMATASLFFVLLVIASCFIIPFVGQLTAPVDPALSETENRTLQYNEHWFKPPNYQNLENKFSAPSGNHLLGTDQVGRDLLARLLYGGQISILVGLVSTTIAGMIGITYGALSGYIGGRTDSLMMRTVDILYGLPFLVIVILISLLFSAYAQEASLFLINKWGWDSEFVAKYANLVPLFIAIGTIGWLTMARITRAQALSIKKLEFIEAARSLGLPHRTIMMRHIMPNMLGPIIVYATLTVPGFILAEATLSYLGLGVQSPNSSWGILLQEGSNYMETQPRLLIVPSVLFSLTLLALNFLGDGLRDALDPKAAKD